MNIQRLEISWYVSCLIFFFLGQTKWAKLQLNYITCHVDMRVTANGQLFQCVRVCSPPPKLITELVAQADPR